MDTPDDSDSTAGPAAEDPDTQSATAADPAAADLDTGSAADRDGVEPRISVILVREWDQQMSSSGCCGRLEGDFLGMVPDGDPVFAERREKMECAGRVYRALREEFGADVEIEVVDPRNLVSLVPVLWSHGRRHGLTPGQRLAQVARVSVDMVAVNGRVVLRGKWPGPVRVLEEARRADTR